MDMNKFFSAITAKTMTAEEAVAELTKEIGFDDAAYCMKFYSTDFAEDPASAYVAFRMMRAAFVAPVKAPAVTEDLAGTFLYDGYCSAERDA
jgi:hypothetical protein